MVGVSFDAPADNLAFKAKCDFPFELLSDGDRKASIDFGAATAESRNATRVSVLIAPNGAVIKTYDTVTPAEHPDEVLADLAAL